MDAHTFLTTVGGVYGSGIGSASPAPASIAASADFDGSATRWLRKTATDIGLNSGHFTLTCFVRPTFLEEIGIIRGICSKGIINAADLPNMQFGMWYTRVSNKVVFQMTDGTSLFAVESSGSLTNNTWAFIEVVYDQTAGTLSLAINRGTAATTTSVLPPQEITEDVRVGHISIAAGVSPWKGQIALLGWYGDPLSSAQLDGIYNSGLGLTYDSLDSGVQTVTERYWQLDESSDGSEAVARTDSSNGIVSLEDDGLVPSSALVPS